MNRYFMIRRLRAPLFLLVIGVMALLSQAHILGFSQSWPLLLILAGVFMLAERAALSHQQIEPPYPVGPAAPQYPAQTSTSIVPAHEPDFGHGDHEDLGGQR